jgi:hypothetical protein
MLNYLDLQGGISAITRSGNNFEGSTYFYRDQALAGKTPRNWKQY